MRTKVPFLIVLFFLAAVITVKSQTPPAKVDLEKVASDLVNQCAGISEGDIVMVSGGVKDLELLENICVDVRKKGAYPMLTINSDRMTRKMFTEVPVKYDSQEPKLGMHMVKIFDAQISVPSGETPGLLADIPPERFKTRNEANKPVQEYLEKNPIKSVALGNGMYPTQANADEFGITLAKLNDIFWSGINIDYAKLSADGKKLAALLKAGDELEISNSNGTSLTVKLGKNESFVSDGIIDDEDLKKGSAGHAVYLPAGEVYLAAVPGSANGKLVVENFSWQGKPVEGLVVEFKNGKMTSLDAKSDVSAIKKYLDVQGKGVDEFSVVDFGINPNVKIPEDSKFVSWMPAGMLTLGMGNNMWAGGENDATGGMTFFVPGCTVKLDGKTLVDGGQLKL